MTVPLISIVDDDADLRLALTNLVRSIGYEAHDHPAAEAFLASGDVHVARCVVTDISMGGMDGIALKNRLDALGILTPVIMITAHFERNVLARALESKPFCLLTKPFDTAEFVATIDRALGLGVGDNA